MNIMNTINIEQTSLKRERILQKIQHEIKTLDLALSEKNGKIDTERLGKLLDKIPKINEQIESKINKEMTSKRKCCKRRTSKITYVYLGIQFLAASAVAAGSIYTFAATKRTEHCPKQIGPAIAEMVVSVISGAVTFFIGEAWQEISREKDKLEILTKISKVDDLGAERLKVFLQKFNEFKQGQSEKDNEVKKLLSECVKRLDELPKQGISENLPSRDIWVSHMIESMMEDDLELKDRIMKLKKTALKILQKKERSTETMISQKKLKVLSSSPKLKINTKKNSPKKKKSSSTEDSDDIFNQFYGNEKKLFNESSNSSSDSPNLQKPRNFDGEKSTFQEINKKSSVISLDDNLSLSDTKSNTEEKHKNNWKLLEKDLGIRFDNLYFDEQIINKDGTIQKINKCRNEIIEIEN